MAHIKLPDRQETFSAPTPLWDPKSFNTFKGSQELRRRSSPAKPPLSPYNGQSATDTRRPHPGHLSLSARPVCLRRMLTSGTPRRGPNALHAPLPSRPRLPERTHVHRLLQRDSGRPAPAGIVRARALLGGDAARGRPGWPGRLSVTKAAVTRAAFLASTLESRGPPARPSGSPEWAEPRRSHAQSSPPAGAAPALVPQGNCAQASAARNEPESNARRALLRAGNTEDSERSLLPSGN